MPTHGGTRTRSLGIRSPTPYPLGHAGIVAAIGFDPMTSGLWAQHASSAPHRYVDMWRLRVSIPLPLACKASALPFELNPPISFIFWSREVSIFLPSACLADALPFELQPLKHSCVVLCCVAPPLGVEPRTLRLTAVRSNQLSYRGILNLGLGILYSILLNRFYIIIIIIIK